MNLKFSCSALALLGTAAPALAQPVFAGDGYRRYNRWDPPRSFNGRIAEPRELDRTPLGWSVNGNANGANLTRSNGS